MNRLTLKSVLACGTAWAGPALEFMECDDSRALNQLPQ